MAMPPESKWYNNETQFWLSIIFFPLFVYGFYKTDLFSTKKKWVLASIAIMAVILINGSGIGAYSNEPCYCKETVLGIHGVVSKSTIKECKDRGGEVVSFEDYLDYIGVK